MSVAWLPLVGLGLGAGALTTVAGQGGGLLLVLALAHVTDARSALLLSAPALLVGNLHRLWLYRTQLDRRTALTFLTGAAPASVLGGALAMDVPPIAVKLLLAAVTILAIARAFGVVRIRPNPRLLVASGAVIGFLCAGAAGAGFLVAPLLLAVGLTGEAYVATAAACAAGMHATRLAGYLTQVQPTTALLLGAAALALAITFGNLIGDRLRKGLPARAGRALEFGTLVTCAALALGGVA